jgi:hypothetical protein
MEVLRTTTNLRVPHPLRSGQRVGSSNAAYPTLCPERKGWGTRRFVALCVAARCFLSDRLEDSLGVPTAPGAMLLQSERQCLWHRVNCLPRQQGRAGNPLPQLAA